MHNEMPDLPMKKRLPRKRRPSKKMLRQKAAEQPRDQGGKFAKEPNFFQRLKMVVDGSAAKKIAAQKAAETRRINKRYQEGAAVIPRAKTPRRSRRVRSKKTVHQPIISYYRQDVIAYLIGRLKFW
jgi:hypothetical protein